MFTGIIEELGRIESIDPRQAGVRLRIGCKTVLSDSSPGASIAVNGVCLTASAVYSSAFEADVAPETLQRSTLEDLKPGSLVNLERPMSPQGRFGGHIVQGHIDGAGVLESLELLGDDNWWLRVRVPPELDRYLVFKGSVAIDGVSLTIAELQNGVIAVTIIPHTFRNTTLSLRRPGDLLNIECDVLAKYVEKMLRAVERPSGITQERLRELGY